MYASKLAMAVVALGAVSVDAHPQLIPKPAMLGPLGLSISSSASIAVQTSSSTVAPSSVATSSATVAATASHALNSAMKIVVDKSSPAAHVPATTLATVAKSSSAPTIEVTIHSTGKPKHSASSASSAVSSSVTATA